MSSKNLLATEYSEKSFVVRGDTQKHKDALLALGGKWNTRLRDGPGWIFPTRLRDNYTTWFRTDKLVQSPFQGVERENQPRQQELSRLEGHVSALTKEVQSLKEMMRRVSVALNVVEEEEVVVEESEEEDEAPRKRLLR